MNIHTKVWGMLAFGGLGACLVLFAADYDLVKIPTTSLNMFGVAKVRIGEGEVASGFGALGVGNQMINWGGRSVVIGNEVKIGYDFGDGPNSITVGRYNKPWVSIEDAKKEGNPEAWTRLFSVGNGTGNAQNGPNNAFHVLDNGRVIITNRQGDLPKFPFQTPRLIAEEIDGKSARFRGLPVTPAVQSGEKLGRYEPEWWFGSSTSVIPVGSMTGKVSTYFEPATVGQLRRLIIRAYSHLVPPRALHPTGML